jgi:K+-transporting ATPase c subunit
MEAIQRAATPALQVEIPTASGSASASALDPSVGKECLQADLDMAVAADASSQDPKAARILSESMAATWEVHQMREILPTASRVPGYSEKSVTQKY